MRRYQQELILDLLKLCKDKQKYLTRLSPNQFDEIIEGIKTCLGYAEQAGTFIEHVYGDGSRTVALLEDYCDLLCAQASTENPLQIKPLNEQLFKITSSVKSELKVDKIEIAFFPYKSSMSDSLESIYLSAKADPQCDPYWIPIPYYDKTNSGSFGKMHYEASDYSDYLECIDWKSYDTESRHPDVIFTHNPYDEFNHVTSIHPDYYSSILKHHTDFLVYVDYGIPYWLQKSPAVSEGTVPLPSMANCSLYAAYSQNLVESVRHVLSVCEPTKDLFTKQQVKEKVLALGSPKFDKVLNTKKEDCTLPDNWRKRIANRKILLFNTTIDSLLKNNDQFLENVKAVIEALSLRDDIVLWWRPHPLTLDTLCSMRPQLLEEYVRIVKDFVDCQQGIYDNTGDLHRAIAWSDGLLTDESSVMFLYLATGKPFTITSIQKKLPQPVHNQEKTFTGLLRQRTANMRKAKGANIGDWNCCIWWDNFLEEDCVNNTHYDYFLEAFIHYIVNTDQYPEAEEYKQLQLQMFRDFVENPDGTAGQKIYDYCKRKVLK